MKNKNTSPYPLLENVFRPHFVGGDDGSKTRIMGFTPKQLTGAYSYFGSCGGKDMKIAIIAAFDNVELENDMRVFCEEFSLPMTQMYFYYPDGRNESISRQWHIESSLDTQWAHVFSPLAEIHVVFSKDAKVDSLLSAAKYASNELKADVVSMSFGRDESSNDKELAEFMKEVNSIFVSSSGDVGGRVSFPSTSPFCISVGGTKLTLDKNKRISEIAWTDSGGGVSRVFEIPLWQGRFYNIYGMSNGRRACPDVAMNASRNMGAAVYDSVAGGWITVGGSSLACACFAGVCALIKGQNNSIENTADMQVYLYSKAGTTGYSLSQNSFFDITLGHSGSFYAQKGWDFCTGLGSVKISNLVKTD